MSEGTVEFRLAKSGDLEELIGLLADDPLGKSRESRDLKIYQDAFEEIVADPNEELIVAIEDEKVIGTVQVSILRHLSRSGARRAQFESVRISKDCRGRGLGKKMIQYAVDRAQSRGCKIVQLTSDKSRTEALEFYTSLGFESSHLGFKLLLP